MDDIIAARFSPLPLWERSPRFLRRVRGVWVLSVERSFALLEKCRRLWKNCERKLNTNLHMVVLAFIGLFLRRM